MSNPLVTLCMIVKDEEQVLSRCLAAAAGLYDELIIVDTGSSDRSVEIAREYGAEILHYDWREPGHKGDARNFGIAAAAGEWIVVVDADEVIREPERLRTILHEQVADAAIMVRFENHEEQAGTLRVALSWYQIRAFRRAQYSYKYREHEIPVPQIANPRIGVSDIVFEHHVPAGRAQRKSAAMLARLTLDVEEHADDPHPLYFLHRECANQGEYRRGIELGLRYLQLTDKAGFVRSECYSNLARCYRALGDNKQALSSLHLAVAEEPQRREWWYRLGILHADLHQWFLAASMLRVALELAPDESRQWEPQIGARILDLYEQCQKAIRATHHEHH